MDIAILAAGVLIVALLSEVVIRESLALAQRFGWSGTFVGLSILSIGTSLPEILTQIVGSAAILHDPALLDTMSGLMLGSNIGSDIFQQNFVLPLVALIGGVVVARRRREEELGGLIAASSLLWLLALDGLLSRWEGAVLTFAYLAYLVFLARRERPSHTRPRAQAPTRRLLFAMAVLAASFIVMAIATVEVVAAAERLVRHLPVSASFFGILVLGIATALPELTTAMLSILKGERGISSGILIGSNITNPLLGIGLGSWLSTYSVPSVVVHYDLPVKIATAALIYAFVFRSLRLNRMQAAILMLLYLAYVLGRQLLFPMDVTSSHCVSACGA
jgi:cation:H+ antiporter